MAALSLFDPWLFLSVGGPVAGAVVAVCSVFGKATEGLQRIDLSWKLIEDSQQQTLQEVRLLFLLLPSCLPTRHRY